MLKIILVSQKQEIESKERPRNRIIKDTFMSLF